MMDPNKRITSEHSMQDAYFQEEPLPTQEYESISIFLHYNNTGLHNFTFFYDLQTKNFSYVKSESANKNILLHQIYEKNGVETLQTRPFPYRKNHADLWNLCIFPNNLAKLHLI